MARFHVRDTFALEDRKTFVLAGFVIEGNVEKGMAVRLPFKENVMLTANIDHIQILRRPDGEVICLCIRCEVAEELILWEALKLKDHFIEVIKAA
jgi:hypothetical protein